jgi:formate hydrogenlyase subunit 3/multisubunit Na+/H+ antiporter MnhD subunit
VLAYSSISQMGLLAAVLGIALAAGIPAAVPIAWYAAMHILVKGGLFLGLGVLAAAAGDQRRVILGCLAVLALSLAGLPLTGGYLAKLAIKPVLGDGLAGWLGLLSAIGSAMLMTHFLMLCERQTEPDQGGRIAGLGTPWIAVVAASILVPWTTGGWLDAALGGLGLGNIVKALGPVLLGIGLAVAFRIWTPTRLALPPGGTDIAGESVRLAAAWIRAWAAADAALRRWQVASTLLLVIAIVLGATMLRSAPAPDGTPRPAPSASP